MMKIFNVDNLYLPQPKAQPLSFELNIRFPKILSSAVFSEFFIKCQVEKALKRKSVEVFNACGVNEWVKWLKTSRVDEMIMVSIVCSAHSRHKTENKYSNEMKTFQFYECQPNYRLWDKTLWFAIKEYPYCFALMPLKYFEAFEEVLFACIVNAFVCRLFVIHVPFHSSRI